MTYEQEINILEKALDRACEYTHNDGLNGCPSNYDFRVVGKEKEKECISCKFYGVYCKNECDDKKYEKKSKKCWKEIFLTGGNI